MARSTSPSLPATRRLRQLGIEHDVVAFDPSIRDAAEVALVSGHAAESVFKTLVVREESPGARPMLAMVPASTELDLKRLARHLGGKKVGMVPHREAERLTGLQVGGISALALGAKGWPVFIDASVEGLDAVLVSAGSRGYDVRLAPADLVRATGASVLELT